MSRHSPSATQQRAAHAWDAQPPPDTLVHSSAFILCFFTLRQNISCFATQSVVKQRCLFPHGTERLVVVSKSLQRGKAHSGTTSCLAVLRGSTGQDGTPPWYSSCLKAPQVWGSFPSLLRTDRGQPEKTDSTEAVPWDSSRLQRQPVPRNCRAAILGKLLFWQKEKKKKKDPELVCRNTSIFDCLPCHPPAARRDRGAPSQRHRAPDPLIPGETAAAPAWLHPASDSPHLSSCPVPALFI